MLNTGIKNPETRMNTGFPGWLGWLESNQHGQSQSLLKRGSITVFFGYMHRLCTDLFVFELGYIGPAFIYIYVRVFLSCGYRGMPQHGLNRSNICAAGQQIGCEAVAAFVR